MSITDIASIIVYDYLWGMPLVIIILVIGFYITVRSGFFQITGFKTAMSHAINSILGKDKSGGKEAGVVSPFEAMSVALGTTIGVGNIGGVATAIAIGGPGAIFWMWIAALCGLIVKVAEITLAVYYRSKDKNNEAYGGPNYYIKKGIGQEKKMPVLAKILSFIFAFGFLTGYFINIQTYTVAEAVANTFDFSMVAVAVFYTIVLYMMISGGVSSLGRIAAKLVPFMCIFYLVGGIVIIFKNISELPGAIGLIFGSAFTGTAAAGGFVGATFAQAIKLGMSRSVFSNEAGWGSAPMIHASAKVDHPIKQGLMGIFEVFVDTFVICSITALVVIMTGEWSNGLDGATLTLSAFETGLGRPGRIILAVGVFLFGVTTSSGVYAQIEVVVRYLIGDTPKKNAILNFYKWTYPIPSLLMVIIAVYYGFPGATLWIFSDASTALPIFANIIALFILFPKFKELLQDYKSRYLGVGKIQSGFKVFYEDENANDIEAEKNM